MYLTASKATIGNPAANLIYRFAMVSFLLLLFGGFLFGQANPPTPAERKEAEKFWEMLVKEKGGREKLHSITNVLSELSESESRLDIFPNLYWGFWRMTETGLPMAEISDLGTNDDYYTGENGAVYSRHGLAFTHRHWRMAVLLETRWDKPEILRVTRQTSGRRSLDAIETKIDGTRFDFVYDPEELLILEVRSYEDNGKRYLTYFFSDYALNDGILMPRTWRYEVNDKSYKGSKRVQDRGPKLRSIKFRFNVDYDPQLFKRPLRARSRDDWKRKTK